MRTPLLLLVAALSVLSLGACAEPTTGSLSLTVDGPVPDALESVSIEWAEEVTWTREVLCSIEGGLSDPSYRLYGIDRSVGGGIDVTLNINAFEGPGSYQRDEFQPTPALVVEFVAEDDAEWRLGSDSGGACSFNVNPDDTSGTFACGGVPVASDAVFVDGLATISGDWSCSAVGSQGLQERGR